MKENWSHNNMIARIIKRFTAPTVKPMLFIGSILGIGALPCPDCGAPMIFHIWPIAGVLVFAQIIRKRNRKELNSSDPNISPIVDIQLNEENTTSK
jgi:hypothetical protein